MLGEALPNEGSAEFDEKVRTVEKELVQKFAWTAQHDGIIYKHDPASLRPMDDKTFNRVSKASHSFPYLDKKGTRCVFFHRMQDVLSAIDDPNVDFGFIFAEAVEFLPDQPEITKDDLGRTVLNLWRKPALEVFPGAPEPTLFLKHVSYLLNDDQIAISHLLDFIAHLIQRPGQRVNHAILITSEAKGIGKSTLGTIIQRLVGERNSGMAQSKDLKSQFDGWLMGKLVVQVDEVYEYGNWDLSNKLKPLLTEPTVSVNVKYGPQMIVKNFARFIMFSNHTAPIDLEEGDRRYFVFNSSSQPKDTDYYDLLNNWIDTSDGMNSIYTWLMKRDISGFRPYAAPPVTEAKRKIIETSGNPLRHYIRDALQSGHLFENLGKEFTLDKIQRLLQHDGFGLQAKNVKELGAALSDAGFKKTRISSGAERSRVYRFPNADVLQAVHDAQTEF